MVKTITGSELAVDNELAMRLRSIRSSAGYSLENMSILTGLTCAEINQAELGMETKIVNLFRLRTALGKYGFS